MIRKSEEFIIICGQIEKQDKEQKKSVETNL